MKTFSTFLFLLMSKLYRKTIIFVYSVSDASRVY